MSIEIDKKIVQASVRELEEKIAKIQRLLKEAELSNEHNKSISHK